MGADLSQRLVPDGLWDLAAPLLPSFTPRRQGGGTAPLDERAVFTAVVYVLACGCAWRHLPPTRALLAQYAARLQAARLLVYAAARAVMAGHVESAAAPSGN
ncbi:transposase [Streptomyces sp. NPDC048825]|uniref:transposase n=1 Tax=Streptomyces sp. NPDC048825 TaxID=3365592 RepID=UPI00371FFBC8